MVLVSHDHRFIFLKTRKTGGTSVEMALQPLCVAPGAEVVEATPTLTSAHGIVGARLARKTPDAVKDGWRNHRSAASTKQALGRRVWDSYARVTLVRDPFDRAVSQFHMTQRRFLEGAPFAAVRTLFRRHILESAWDDDRDIVFVDDVFVPTEVFRFERMADDLAAFFARKKLPFSRENLPHVKKSRADRVTHPVAEYFDDDTRDVVLRRMAWVFERFGYPETP